MKTLTDSQKLRIERLLNEFDFEKVHRTMLHLDWRWQNELPTMPQLRAVARQCLVAAVDAPIGSKGGTGGFQAEIAEDSEGKPQLKLSFVLTYFSEEELPAYKDFDRS
jgi:hypothetical protein